MRVHALSARIIPSRCLIHAQNQERMICWIGSSMIFTSRSKELRCADGKLRPAPSALLLQKEAYHSMFLNGIDRPHTRTVLQAQPCRAQGWPYYKPWPLVEPWPLV